MNWQVINSGTHSEAMHHAIDDVLTDRMAAGDLEPTIRFWYREEPAIPMGRYQSYRDEVQDDYVQDEGISVVRRNTGGGAMFAEPGNVITYSLYLPRDAVPSSFEDSYRDLDAFAVETLQDLGVDAEYQPLNDIECPEGKLGGAAQLRRGDAVLHHTMISYDLNTERMLRALRIGKAKLSDKAVKSAEKRVARVRDQVEMDREAVIDQLIEHRLDGGDRTDTELSDDVLAEAKDRVRERFGTDEWTHRL